MRELKISYGDSRLSKRWVNKKTTFEELCQRFKDTRRTTETVAEYKKFSKDRLTRLYYYGIVQMGMSEEVFWLMPIGLFFDLWVCHKQWHGIEKPKKARTIDDIIPPGI